LTSSRRFSIARSVRTSAGWLVLLAVAAASSWAAYLWSERNGYERLDDTAARQLDLYAALLENELGKQAYLPALIELDHDIEGLFAAPSRAAARDAANRKLAKVAVSSGALATFVADDTGLVLAASDWYWPDSMVGKNVSKRAYFVDAMNGNEASLFAPNLERGASEYCFARPVTRSRRIVAVIVACSGLEPMEATWSASAFRADSEKPLVVDENGVVIISSVPEWKFRTMSPMAGRDRDRLMQSGLYPKRAGEPLGIKLERELPHGAKLVSLRRTADEPAVSKVVHERPVARFGWRLLILSDADEVWRSARYAAWGAGALTAFAGLLLAYMLQRRRVIAQKLATRAALQRANDELERKVEERTSQLQATNVELLHEVAERRHAEEVLRQAQEKLVQAGKLALLGQMSAGISHEIGQPLTALRALSENARLLLERGLTDDVAENLASISDVAERMGRINAQLKSFARKAPGEHSRVSVAHAIANACLLLQARLKSEDVQVQVDASDALMAHCDGIRLEQVLVNLMVNAIDAMSGQADKRLCVAAQSANQRIVVRVTDNGPGIPATLRERLFEPFFTTKPVGEGLGLGLVISANIVVEFGGALRAVEAQQGAAFEFEVPQAQGEVHV
jgi:two-component system C4-dicarboxylate transport sensor histidine kinase DctB